MKNPEARFTTLSPVRRVTAFFAFICASVCLLGCQPEETRTPAANLADQSQVFHQMASLIDGLSEQPEMSPEDLKASLEQLHVLIDSQRLYKRELATLVAAMKEKPDLSGNDELGAAQKVFFHSLSRYESTPSASPKVAQALQNLHDPAPMKGEGSPQ